MRRGLLLGVIAVALLAAPLPAGATARFVPCGQTPGLGCTEVTVPLDRSGQTPGTISLHVEYLPVAAGVAQRGVVFLIAGGPGQGSAHSFGLGSPDGAARFRFLFPDYALVAYDDRGTGASGVLRCPALQAAGNVSAEAETALAAACANIIGPQRRFYSTADHAEDLEAVRQMIGADKIALFGVSYGTKLALAYALAHPDHVERLLLDSVLPADLPDPYASNFVRAMPATLASFCAGGICRAATPDFAGDVVALANQIEAKPISARVLQTNGTLKTERMNGEDLLSTVVDADLSPGLAAELPAAVHAARQGDPDPLVRLFDIAGKMSIDSTVDLSSGLNAATTCDDGLFPWQPQTAVADRAALLQSAIAALPTGSFGPFGSWAARMGSAQFCLDWPAPAGGTPLGAGPLPDVPMLAISGGFDMRTPTASATAVASLFPQGHVLLVPGVGHSVLGTDLTRCSQQVVRNWVVGGSVPPSCPRVPPWIAPLAAFPKTAGATPAATLSVAVKTIQEGSAAWLQVALGGSAPPLSGIYSGKLVSGADSFALNRYSIVPGVELTGKLKLTVGAGLPLTFTGTVKVAGSAAAAGTLRFDGKKATGVLAGRHVDG